MRKRGAFKPSCYPGRWNEYFLNLYAYTKVATDLVPVHYEVAKEQIKLNKGSFFASLSACSGKLSYETKDHVLSFQSGAVSGKIDLKKECCLIIA